MSIKKTERQSIKMSKRQKEYMLYDSIYQKSRNCKLYWQKVMFLLGDSSRIRICNRWKGYKKTFVHYFVGVDSVVFIYIITNQIMYFKYMQCTAWQFKRKSLQKKNVTKIHVQRHTMKQYKNRKPRDSNSQGSLLFKKAKFQVCDKR